MAEVAYVRVSSADQKYDRQLEALKGLDLKKVFKEKASAKDAQRPELQFCMEWLREGDTLHVHSMDRLARNLMDMRTIVEDLTRRRITVQFHKENMTFTGGENAVQKLLFQVMGAFAEFERELIKERQREGIKAARAAGKQIGRAKKLSKEQVLKLKQEASEPDANKSKLAEKYGIGRKTLYRYLKDDESVSLS